MGVSVTPGVPAGEDAGDGKGGKLSGLAVWGIVAALVAGVLAVMGGFFVMYRRRQLAEEDEVRRSWPLARSALCIMPGCLVDWNHRLPWNRFTCLEQNIAMTRSACFVLPFVMQQHRFELIVRLDGCCDAYLAAYSGACSYCIPLRSEFSESPAVRVLIHSVRAVRHLSLIHISEPTRPY